MSIRHTYFSGSFYPADAAEIKHYISKFDEISPPKEDCRPRAIIVPHAGYVYSGFTANLAHRYDGEASRIIVIGPSHRVAYPGTSISLDETYETPLGAVSVDTAYAERLKEQFGLGFEPVLHQEHSTEVQMPFVKYYNPDVRVIEMVYSDETPQRLSTIIAELLKDPDNLVIISTDLSHFYTEEEARHLDERCLQAINEEEVTLLHEGCEACGKIGVEAVLIAARELHLQTRLLDYRTSAWASGDTSRVVGYTSALIY